MIGYATTPRKTTNTNSIAKVSKLNLKTFLNPNA